MNNSVFISHSSNDWKVRLSGQEKDFLGFNDKLEALKYALMLAKEKNLEIIIQRKDGIFQFRKY